MSRKIFGQKCYRTTVGQLHASCSSTLGDAMRYVITRTFPPISNSRELGIERKRKRAVSAVCPSSPFGCSPPTPEVAVGGAVTKPWQSERVRRYFPSPSRETLLYLRRRSDGLRNTTSSTCPFTSKSSSPMITSLSNQPLGAPPIYSAKVEERVGCSMVVVGGLVGNCLRS